MINQDQLLSTLRSILAIAGGWAVARGYVTADQIVLVGGVLTALVPLVWGIFVHSASQTVKAAAATPGVEKVVMESQAAADKIAPKDATGTPQPDKILSPSEDLSHVSQQPGVVAVVLKSAVAADANPSEKVIGPSAIAPKP